MPERFHHGTSTEHLGAIKNDGLKSASETGVITEKRKDGNRQVYLTDGSEKGRRAAQGYAIRSSLRHGGQPILLEIEGDKEKHGIVLERSGQVDQYAAGYIPPDAIVGEVEVDDPTVEHMNEYFSGPHQK